MCSRQKEHQQKNRKPDRFHTKDRIFHIQSARALAFTILPRHATLAGLPSSQYLPAGLLLFLLNVAPGEEVMPHNPFEIPKSMRDNRT